MYDLSGGRLDNSDPHFEQIAYELISRHRLFPIAKELVDFSECKERPKWDIAIRNCTMRSMHLTKVLIDLLNAFHNLNLRITPIKGPALALALYGDVGKRQYVDLDLLIAKEELELAIQIASEMGFILKYPEKGFSEKRWSYYFKWKNDVVLFHESERIFIEFHVGIYYHKLLPEQLEFYLLRDLTEESIGGIPFDCMNRNSTFLYLVFHGGFHQYFLLFWLRDISEALLKWDLNHNLIMEYSREMGIDRLLGVSLFLAKRFFNTEIPEAYRLYLEEHSAIIEMLSGLCIERITGKEKLTLYGKFRRFKYNFNLKPGLNYRWSVISSIFHHWYIRKFLGGQ